MAVGRNSNLGLIGILGLIWYFSRTGSSVEKLNYQISRFRVLNFTDQYVKTQLSLTIGNPTSAQLIFSEFYGAVSYQGNLISQISLQPRIIIYPSSVKEIQIPVNLLISELIGAGINLLQTRRLSEVHITGRVVLNGISYPVDVKIPLT